MPPHAAGFHANGIESVTIFPIQLIKITRISSWGSFLKKNSGDRSIRSRHPASFDLMITIRDFLLPNNLRCPQTMALGYPRFTGRLGLRAPDASVHACASSCGAGGSSYKDATRPEGKLGRERAVCAAPCRAVPSAGVPARDREGFVIWSPHARLQQPPRNGADEQADRSAYSRPAGRAGEKRRWERPRMEKPLPARARGRRARLYIPGGLAPPPTRAPSLFSFPQIDEPIDEAGGSVSSRVDENDACRSALHSRLRNKIAARRVGIAISWSWGESPFHALTLESCRAAGSPAHVPHRSPGIVRARDFRRDSFVSE